jgi:hypothetical protein
VGFTAKSDVHSGCECAPHLEPGWIWSNPFHALYILDQQKKFLSCARAKDCEVVNLATTTNFLEFELRPGSKNGGPFHWWSCSEVSWVGGGHRTAKKECELQDLVRLQRACRVGALRAHQRTGAYDRQLAIDQAHWGGGVCREGGSIECGPGGVLGCGPQGGVVMEGRRW